ncbi:hypothetical protein HNQ60_000174 [Povalibacter uvarum]|uniref:DUF4062 domain-containing protein n=1 Tax=Povalibacter uvarum TaxID=732238 RepID=A0A841HG98_9GAMM|nr:DUF4062 domain-containing protein [Povalibacter uvarum]MBB6091328.1 hypothetical protein [Povalibacter uvarum]
MAIRPRRVFISFTAEDLGAHADSVVDVLRQMEWIAIDHRDWAPTGERSVAACRKKLEECDIVVLLVAHRYGWVPPVRQDGDGRTSITWLEYRWARELGKPVVPLLSDPKGSWSVAWLEKCFEATRQTEIAEFRAEVGETIAAFFTEEPGSVLQKLEAGLRAAAENIEHARANALGAGDRQRTLATILPRKLPYLCDRSLQSFILRLRIAEHIRWNPTRPLLCVVHGDAREAHAPFVERVEEQLLPELLPRVQLRGESRFAYLDRLEPAEVDAFARGLRMEMGDKLQLQFANDRELIESLQDSRLGALIAVVQVRAKECRRAPAAIFDAIHGYWRNFPATARQMLVGCIISVKYDDAEQSGLMSWLPGTKRERARDAIRLALRELQQRNGTMSQAPVCVLPELQSVTKQDLEQWVGTVRTKLPRHFAESDYVEMFGHADVATMDAVINYLQNWIGQSVNTA